LKTLTLIFCFLWLSLPAFASFEEAEKLMAEKNFIAARQELEKIKNPEDQARILYLQAWIEYGLKNYEKSLDSSKTLFSKYKDSSYLLPSLILSARINLMLGKKEQSLKMARWVLDKKPAKNEVRLMAEMLIFFLERRETAFKPAIEFLMSEWLFEKNDPATPKEAPKKSLPALEKNARLKDQILYRPQEESLKKEEFGRAQTHDHVREMEEIKKNIQAKQKELEILQILLEEKKRLLYLKEKYLSEREKAQQDSGEAKP